MNIDRHEITRSSEEVSFPLCIQSYSSLLAIPLSSLTCSVVPVGAAIPTVTTTTHPAIYTVHCSPVTRGCLKVNVKINGVQVASTSLYIPFNPYLDNNTPACTIPELNTPFGVAATDDGHIIVSERGSHCVTVLNRDGKKMKSFGQGSENVKFSQPRGIAITSDNFILVADNHKIQKISMDGKCITSIGKQGSGPLEFNEPNGITISQLTGYIYIADYNNHRIQVLNSDLTLSRIFGSHGSAEGEFNHPVDVATDRQGLVYVTDCWNHRIQKFSFEGYILSGIKRQFIYPTGIVIDDNNLIYIAESGNRCLSVFTTDGQFVRSFGEYGSSVGHFNDPYGITFDKEGYLYICDRSNDRLVVY